MWHSMMTTTHLSHRKKFPVLSSALLFALSAGVSPRCQAQAANPTPAPTPAFQTSDYRFQSSGAELVGRLFAPRGAQKFALVILVEGSDYDDANASIYWRLIANGFAKNGIASFSFNKRGIGGSGGAQTEDFDVLADDVAAACSYASHLPGVDSAKVGYYGISQGGWIVPRAVKKCAGAFVVLVSPGGIPPAETDNYYLQGQFRAVGMTAAEQRDAMVLHNVLASYYRTGKGYAATQRLVDRDVRTAWFAKFNRIEFRQDVPGSHRIPTPGALRADWQNRPDLYGFYRNQQTWSEPSSLYESLTAPLLLVYGGQDTDVPIERSMAVFQSALRDNKNPDVTIHIFETADHSIQVGPRLLPGYREYLADWIKQQVR